MKCKFIFFFIFFQNIILFSQTSNTIDIKIEEKHYQNKNPPVCTSELIFNSEGKLLKRIGYKIEMFPDKLTTDLVETNIYSDEGLLKIILVQEKDTTNTLKVRFQSKYLYNEKKQLIEMINFNYIFDSIQQKITFEYDDNGNRIRINKNDSEYILSQYDTNNKYIKSQLFKNNKYAKDVKISNEPTFTYRDLPNLQSSRSFTREVYLPHIKPGEKHLIKDKINFTYYKNGIIKTKKNIESYNNSVPPIELIYIYQIKCDGKTKYDESIIKKINNEILQINNWQ